MIKLALTDLDDTLIAFGRPHASSRARAAMHAIIDAGLHVGPVSGRTPTSMGWMFAGDAACFATGAFVNGQMIFIDGDLVHTETIPADALRRARDLCDETGIGVVTIQDVTMGESSRVVTRNPARIGPMFELMDKVHFDTSAMMNAAVTDFEADAYVKVNIHCVNDWARVAELRELLREACPELGFVYPSTRVPLIDVTPGGWNKGVAVRVLAERLGITNDEIAVFGDSENDLAMIEAVPNSVAVANATDGIAAAARWHIGAAADDAVARAFEDIAAASGTGEMPTFMHD